MQLISNEIGHACNYNINTVFFWTMWFCVQLNMQLIIYMG